MHRLLVHVLLMALSLSLRAAASHREPLTLTAPDGTPVLLQRDTYGVPHIRGESEIGVFFGQGFAIAQDRLIQLEEFRRLSEGRSAQILGPDFLELDQQTRTLFYTRAERRRQFEALPAGSRHFLEAYRDGINTYLDSMQHNPDKYFPQQAALATLLGLEIEPWSVENSVAIIQFLMRRFGQYGGQELTRLTELQSLGADWFEEHRPINDPATPTTIRGSSAKAGEKAARPQWAYSGPSIRPGIARSLAQKNSRLTRQLAARGLPTRLGSFAVLISATKSTSGNVMLLGAPQMGPPREEEVSVVNEVELLCPSLHIGGITVAGIPGVIIGHNQHLAWSFTSGWSDNTDVYIDNVM